MNNRRSLLLFLIAFASCTYNNVDLETQGINLKQPEKWQLVEMTGNIANVPPLTESKMPWQEWYVFYPDHSFSKIRVRDNVTIDANGSYRVVTLSDGQYLELLYPSVNDLIGNCSAEAKELLAIKHDDELIGTWWACDGPGLFYKKVKSHDERPE